MSKAKTIREACLYEARNNLTGNAALKLTGFAMEATDAELIRFADLICNATQPVDHWEPTDSADLARLNID